MSRQDSSRKWVYSLLYSVGTVWGAAAGFAVVLHGLNSILSAPLNFVLDLYMVAFGVAIVIIECHERCAQVEWFAASNRRERGKWVLGLLLVASLCLNQWTLTGLGAGGATLSRALGLGLRMFGLDQDHDQDQDQDQEDLNDLTEEEHVQLQSRQGPNDDFFV